MSGSVGNMWKRVSQELAAGAAYATGTNLAQLISVSLEKKWEEEQEKRAEGSLKKGKGLQVSQRIILMWGSCVQL